MNVLALTADSYSGKGGIAEFNRIFFRALMKTGYIHNIFIQSRNQESSDIQNDLIVDLNKSGSKAGYVFSTIINTLKYKPDVIFCGHINLVLPAWIIAKIFGIPVWLNMHGIEAWKKPGQIKSKIIKSAKLVTCVSRFTRNKFLSWANMPPSRVMVLPNSIDENFKPGDRELSRKKLGLNADKILLTVGRLSTTEQYKGQDKVINALPEILESYPDLIYIIAGEGDDKNRLEIMAREKGVIKHVLFSGSISSSSLPDYYSAADLFVMPSTGEGFGIVYLEAMASGTRAMGLNEGGSIDPLQDGLLGMVTTEDKLAQDIISALGNNNTSDIAEQVIKTFGYKNFCQHVKCLFELLLSRQVGTSCAE